MSENSRNQTTKEKKTRGGVRVGAGRKTLPANQKKEQFNMSLPPGDALALKMLIPSAAERNLLFKKWVRAYVIAGGKTDRLLAQSPLAAEILSYLEAQEDSAKAQELADKLQLLIVNRELDELRAEDAIELPGGSWIV